MNSSLYPIDILLVEDNPGDVRLTQEALRDAKVANRVTVVPDGVEAPTAQPRSANTPGCWGGPHSRSASTHSCCAS